MAWLGAAAWLGCAPSPSTVPLGLGPLALAEQASEAEAAAARGKKAKAPGRRTRSPAPEAPEPASEAKAAEGEPEQEATATAAPPASGTAFEGMFAGDDVAVFRLTGFPDREQRDDQAKIRIEGASGGNVSITLINSEDGSDLCELLARVEGNAALIESPQPCFGDGSEGSLAAELTSGRAVIEGDRLKMDAEGTLSVSLPDQELDGELSYTFEGERQ